MKLTLFHAWGRRLCLLLLFSAWIAPATNGQAQEQDEALVALIQVLKDTPDDTFRLDVLKGIRQGLEGRRQVPMPPGWPELEEQLRVSSNPALSDLGRALALTFGSPRALREMRDVVQDARQPVTGRLQAMDALIAAKPADLKDALLEALEVPALRAKAIQGVASLPDPEIAPRLLNLWSTLKADERRLTLGGLASRPASAQLVLLAVQEGRLEARDLSADLVRQLRELKDEGITAKVNELWGVVRDTPEAKKAEMESYRKVILAKTNRKPDLPSGRALFARTCQQCHTLYGVGGAIGPDITGSNRADLDYLLHNVVDPNAEIPNDYRTSSVDTVDDRVLTGIITARSASSLTIVTATGKETIPMKEVTHIQASELSMMPEGLLAVLKPNEIRDLVAYLQSKGQVPMALTTDSAGLWFDGQSLTGWSGNMELWSVKDGVITGHTPTGLKKNEFLIAPVQAGDFRLSVEVLLEKNQGNSGIQFRSTPEKGGSVKGYQADIGAGWWGKLYEEHGRALLWKESGEKHLRPGEWNTYVIEARGSQIRTFLNGQPCVDLNDPEGAKTGILAFQLHSGGPTTVHFRKLELAPLP